MKGQYLALESVLTFGLGLIAAVGIIGVFDTYSAGIYDTSEQVEAEIVSERVLNDLNAMRPVTGEMYREVSLPEDISNRDYTVIFEDDLIVEVRGNEYRSQLPGNESFSGSGSGDIRIYKNSTGFEMVDT